MADIRINIAANQAAIEGLTIKHQNRAATFMAFLFMALVMCGMYAVASDLSSKAGHVQLYAVNCHGYIGTAGCCKQWRGGDGGLL